MTDEEFEKRTIDAIRREFGLGGVSLFLMAYRSGNGDYTAERQDLLHNVTMAEIVGLLGDRACGRGCRRRTGCWCGGFCASKR
jgi:hypothetical protein